MKKVIKFLEADLPLLISCAALTTSVLLAIANAVARYTVSHVINGADAIIAVCFAYTVYVGSAVALKQGQHYGVDLLVTNLSARGQKIAKLVLDILILVVMSLCLYLSIQLTMKAGNKIFEGLGLPYTVYDFSAVLGFGYSALYALEFIVEDFKSLTAKEEN